MTFNYGTNMAAGIGAGSAAGMGSTGGGGGGFWNWSNFTNTSSKYWDPKPGLGKKLGSIGAAISPEGSWQQRLSSTAAQMGEDEQSRRYLSELLAGGSGGAGKASAGGGTSGAEKEGSALGSLGDLGTALSDYFNTGKASSSKSSSTKQTRKPHYGTGR